MREVKDYKNYKDLILKFLYMYYNHDCIKDKANKEPFDYIKTFLFNLDDLISKSFLEIDLTTHRNLNDWKFPAELSSFKRHELTNIIKESIEKIEPNVFYKIKNYNLKNENNYNNNNDKTLKGNLIT
jgi:hypothetical protein